MQQLGNAVKQRLFDLQWASGTERDLNYHQIIAATDIQILRIVDKVCSIVLGNDLETVLLRNENGVYKAAVNCLRYFLLKGLVLIFLY